MHIILFKGRLQTLDFFMDRFIDYCKAHDIDYYLVDTNVPDTYNSPAFDEYLAQENCAMFTFNNIGVNLDIPSGNIWKCYNIPVYNFIVDPPRAFKNILLHPACDIRVISLDKNRDEFIGTFYPEIKKHYYFPAGGAVVSADKQLKDRKFDVIYMGNCQAKEQDYPYLDFLGEKCAEMYRSTIYSMIEDPSQTTEEALNRYFAENEIKLTIEQLTDVMTLAGQPIEHTVRRFFKLRGIKALDDAGIKVDIWGSNWNDDDIPFSDNVTVHRFIPPKEVMEICGDAKISLVFIGWQKRGCSEKNFDSFLNRACCVSDSTEYLLEHYKDGDNIVYFDLHNMEQMAADVKYLLEHIEAAQVIADRGYETALKYDSWDVRYDQIYKMMLNECEIAE